MSSDWRPLVGQDKLPRWARLRDVALTLLVWLVLLWLMRHLRLVLWLALPGEMDVPASLQDLSLQPKWDIAAPFLLTAALLILLLAWVTWHRRELLQAQPQARDEPILDPAAHAAHFGLDFVQLAALRRGQVRVVRFDGDGRIVGVDPVPG